LFLLGIIGILHAILLSQLDVLLRYALLGYVLLLFRNSSVRVLLGAALGSLLLAFVLRVLMTFVNVYDYLGMDGGQSTSALINIYAHGTYAEMVWQRIAEVANNSISFVFSISYKVFAMFLLGACAGRLKIFQNVAAHRPLLQRIMWGGLAIGLVSNLLYALITILDLHFSLSILEFTLMGVFAVGDIALAAFYVSGMALLLENPQWKQRLAPLTYIGRMALTNYIMQSLLCTTLFYSYGLGMYGNIGAAITILIACAIYLFQMMMSGLWLQWFRYGPLEWVWRSLTYNRCLPIRVVQPAVRKDKITIP
jgi:uncharacterized protein